MKKLLLVFCSVWGWACIIGAWVVWGYKAAAAVAFASLMTAIIAAVLTHESEAELTVKIAPIEEILNDTEGDGNAE